MKCLFVDDDAMLLSMLKFYFTKRCKSFYNFFFANDAFEARKTLFRENGVDILVSDQHMPGENGLSLATFVISYWPNTRIVLMSSDDNNIPCYATFIHKPFSLSQLESLVVI